MIFVEVEGSQHQCTLCRTKRDAPVAPMSRSKMLDHIRTKTHKERVEKRLLDDLTSRQQAQEKVNIIDHTLIYALVFLYYIQEWGESSNNAEATGIHAPDLREWFDGAAALSLFNPDLHSVYPPAPDIPLDKSFQVDTTGSDSAVDEPMDYSDLYNVYEPDLAIPFDLNELEASERNRNR